MKSVEGGTAATLLEGTGWLDDGARSNVDHAAGCQRRVVGSDMEALSLVLASVMPKPRDHTSISHNVGRMRRLTPLSVNVSSIFASWRRRKSL